MDFFFVKKREKNKCLTTYIVSQVPVSLESLDQVIYDEASRGLFEEEKKRFKEVI